MKDPKQGLLKQSNILKWKKRQNTHWGILPECNEMMNQSISSVGRGHIHKHTLCRYWTSDAETSGGLLQLKIRNRTMKSLSDLMDSGVLFGPRQDSYLLLFVDLGSPASGGVCPACKDGGQVLPGPLFAHWLIRYYKSHIIKCNINSITDFNTLYRLISVRQLIEWRQIWMQAWGWL